MPDRRPSMKYEPEFKKSPAQILRKFAVCDIPLYDICDYNVSRDRCKDLGCCYYKSVCYEKAVPTYVKVFSAFIIIIATVFIVAVIYRLIRRSGQESPVEAKERETVTETVGQSTVPETTEEEREEEEEEEEEED